MSTYDDERRLSPVEAVPISLLRPSDSPRRAGEDEEHVRTLASSGAQLPPIIVHRPSMRVIDGMHRLKAARLRGRDRIDARYFEGSAPDAFVLAVSANVGHGLPLSGADRAAAALRILGSHPHWADRAIAAATGLSAKTIAALRRSIPPPSAAPTSRIGRDGRVRPLDCADARRRAAEFVAHRPEASLREIARAVGLSPGTVRDVRERLRRGEEPVPTGRRLAEGAPSAALGLKPIPAGRRSAGGGAVPSSRPLLDVLRKDPSLRMTETGRHLLRLLDTHAIPALRRRQLVDSTPAHCAATVAELARECAAAWGEVARLLERKHDAAPPRTVRPGEPAARRVATVRPVLKSGAMAAEPQPVAVTVENGHSTRTAMLLSPMLAEWDGGEHFRAVTEPLAEAGYRVTFLDTLSLLGPHDDLGLLARRWAAFLGAQGGIDLLGGNGLGGTVVQSLLGEPWARRSRVLLFCAPTRPDAVLLGRVGGIARRAAEQGLQAAYQYAAHLMAPGTRDGSPPAVPIEAVPVEAVPIETVPVDAVPVEAAPADPEQARAVDRMVRGIGLLTGADAAGPVAAFPGPVLHVVGECSQIVRERHLGAGPNQRRLVVPGAGMRPYDERPDLVLPAVRDLIAAQTAA